MVKIPKAPKSKIRFRDEHGKFVKQSERYQKARVVERWFRGKYHPIVDLRDRPKKKLSPKILADLLPRDAFEELAPNYGEPVTIKPQAKKYTAWDTAGQIERQRGLRGHMVKVEMYLRDGRSTKKVGFFIKVKRRGQFQYSLFRKMNSAIGNEKKHLYNRIGSKILPDRRGRRVHLMKVEVSKEL